MKSALRIARAASTWMRGQRHFQPLAERGEAPVPVLFYHRVADRHPSSTTISCSKFARHIRFLRANFQVVPLCEVQHRLSHRISDSRRAAITFDDGYAENNEFALPLLVEHQLPCLYFVSVNQIRDQIPFPHDAAAGVELRPNTIDDIRRWSRAGIEIGLHTRTHFDFSQPHDEKTIHDEIVTAAAELADWIDRPVRYFAFPYGLPDQLSQSVIAKLHELGFAGYCSAYGAYNFAGQDTTHIRRIHGDPEMARFYNWMYFDPQKLQP